MNTDLKKKKDDCPFKRRPTRIPGNLAGEKDEGC